MRHNIFLDIMFLENFSRLQKNDRLFRSLTGLTIDKFNSLVGKFSERYQTSQQNRLKNHHLAGRQFWKAHWKRRCYCPREKLLQWKNYFI